jgi:FtsP/CotA-like multicopper oxidase with cupredoxin domain
MIDHLTKLTDRRSFLRRLLTTTSLVATGAASAPVWAQSHGAHGAHGPRVRNTAPATPAPLAALGPPFANPPTISGSNGKYALNVIMRQATLGSQPVNVMAYVDANHPPVAGAYLVAPTITITGNGQPVQPVSVALTNLLPAESKPAKPGPVTEAHVHDAPFGFYTTNLHVHGLHVDPFEDNVYIELQPAANGSATDPACAPTRANPVWVCNGSYTYSYNFGRTPNNGRTQIPAGTYWYHPHKHGSVGVQVASGMAGAFIVQGDLDAIPGVAGLAERVMVAQLVAYIPAAHPSQPAIVDPNDFYAFKPANTQLSINGQINPTIDMQYGEIQRWRFINATADQFFYLNVTGPSGTTAPVPELYAIAVDGVPLTNSEQGITVPFKLGKPLFQFPMGTASTFADAVMNEIAILAPAQRLDLLVRLPPTTVAPAGPVNYSVQAVPYVKGTPPLDTQTIATIQVAGAKTTPDQLPAPSAFNAGALYRPPLREQSAWPMNPTQNIQFGFIEGNTGALVNNSTSATPFGVAAGNPPPPAALAPPPPPAGASSFALPFPPSGAQLQLKLNAVDYWQVSSNANPSIGFGPHAFHIHINSFMITKRNGVDISSARIWRDTARIDQPPQTTSPSPGVAVSTGVGQGALSPIVPVEFVSQQVDYVGDFVVHCHLLQHEDAGMMWSVSIS